MFETALADAIENGDLTRVRELFAEHSSTAAGRAKAWQALGAHCERAASGKSIKGAPGVFFEREIRQLGPVVAWTESRVTEQRTLQRPTGVEVRVLATTEEANALVTSELDGASCSWGYRPAKGELPDLRAHNLERERMIAQGDVAGLDAYTKRYVRPVLMSAEGRLRGYPPYRADDVLGQVVQTTDDLRVVEWALGLGPSASGIGFAAGVAIERGQTAKLEAILARSTEPEPPIHGGSLLSVAALVRRPAAVRVLLARGAKPDVVFDGFFVKAKLARAKDDGHGPLVNAVRNDDLEVVELLLAAKADPLSKTHSGRRVLDMAKELGDAPIVEALERAAGSAAAAPVDMSTALASFDVERVLALLPTEGSNEAIQQWAQFGKAAELTRVLESGVTHSADALAKALWTASCNGYLETVNLLLAHGADPNAYKTWKKTARAIAKDNGHTAIVTALQKAGGKLRA